MNVQKETLALNAMSEIGTGLVLIFQLFTKQRSILITMMYWQWLRLRYHTTDSAAIHRQALAFSFLCVLLWFLDLVHAGNESGARLKDASLFGVAFGLCSKMVHACKMIRI